MGAVGLAFEAYVLLSNMLREEDRAAMLAVTVDQLKGAVPLLLWFIALLGTFAVIVVWL